MLRRLPVYLLIDCSESMIGQGIEAVRAGISSMVSSLRRDPHALESVYISVITYDYKARLECSLTPLIDFQEPKLCLRPGTSLGAALNLLADQIQSEIRKTTFESKGDYRPLVLLLTDGQPSDDWRTPLRRIGAKIRPRPANIYAIGCGEDVDYAVLQGVTDVVLQMEDMSPESFGKLFVWLTASVSNASQGIGENAQGEINLQKLPQNVEKLTTPARSIEGEAPRQVFLRARCSVKRQHYLMRYRLNMLTQRYDPIMTHKLTEEEVRAAGDNYLPDIASDLINGILDCPWCTNSDGIHCGNCSAILCSNLSEINDIQCPSCNMLLKRRPESEGGSFSVRQSGG